VDKTTVEMACGGDGMPQEKKKKKKTGGRYTKVTQNKETKKGLTIRLIGTRKPRGYRGKRKTERPTEDVGMKRMKGPQASTTDGQKKDQSGALQEP